MGNESSEMEGQTFQKRNWELVSSREGDAVWRNRSDPSQSIIEHTIYSSSDAEESEERQMFVLRKNNPALVAARYLISEPSAQFCSSSHLQKLFIEKIPIRLSDVEHVPFPDCLHVYHQCLRGFQQLARHVGCFPIEEEYIGINEKGVVKVWMNENYFKNYYTGSKISEELMVKNLVQIVENNLDLSQIPREIPSIRNYLYRNSDKLLFESANNEFNDFVVHYFNGQVPSRLQCIDRVGGIDAIVRRQRQPPLEKDYASRISQSPYYSIHEEQANHSILRRPQLVDSQLLNQFPVSTPRIVTSPGYFQVPGAGLRTVDTSQFVPIIQKSIQSPSMVREHTPIVRKSATIYNSPAVFAPYKPINQSHNSAVFANRVPTAQGQLTMPQIRYRLNQRPESKSFGGKATPILYRPQQIIAAPSSQQPILPQINSLLGAKTSLIELVQPQTPKYNEEAIRAFNFARENSAFLKEATAPPQKQNLPEAPKHQAILSIDSPSSFLFERPSSKSLTERTEKRLNSYVITSANYVNLYAATNNPIIAQTTAADHQIKSPQTKQKQSFTYSSDQSNGKQLNYQNNFLKRTEENNAYLPKSSVKASQYTTVDIDDGKSSSDFLKKLKQLNTFDVNFQPQSKELLPTYKNSYFNQQRPPYPLSNRNGFGQSGITKGLNSLQNLNQSEDELSSQQFGRNAVSNIISNQSGINITSHKNINNNTPLKFEKNLDMKYSMFKPDEPPSPTYGANYAYKGYEPNYDADILADINKLRS